MTATVYPEDVMTRSKKGKLEVRSLVDRGTFVRYEYLDAESGKRGEDKVRLVLVPDGKGAEEYFVIPMKGVRFLMLPTGPKGERKVWDGERAVDI